MRISRGSKRNIKKKRIKAWKVVEKKSSGRVVAAYNLSVGQFFFFFVCLNIENEFFINWKQSKGKSETSATDKHTAPHIKCCEYICIAHIHVCTCIHSIPYHIIFETRQWSSLLLWTYVCAGRFLGSSSMTPTPAERKVGTAENSNQTKARSEAICMRMTRNMRLCSIVYWECDCEHEWNSCRWTHICERMHFSTLLSPAIKCHSDATRNSNNTLTIGAIDFFNGFRFSFIAIRFSDCFSTQNGLTFLAGLEETFFVFCFVFYLYWCLKVWGH